MVQTSYYYVTSVLLFNKFNSIQFNSHNNDLRATEGTDVGLGELETCAVEFIYVLYDCREKAGEGC